MSEPLEDLQGKNTPNEVPVDTDTAGGEMDSDQSASAPVSAISSSLSSFVPVCITQDAIQVIDEKKQFNQEILNYLDDTIIPNMDHRIVSVFGSQSTGKSTLLNHLFNTNFGVMDEVNRQQTTKGIWLAVSPAVNNSAQVKTSENVIVMDVEGTDGRERGEDQDFERKAALFAMSTSEILIVNLWETQVGLYQGANMALLKTVFEVNLSLFGKAKTLEANDHKVLLLFVIRDHLGVTPKDSLSATITQDLLRIWDNLSKPQDLAHLAFDDFFDLAFHTLSHKVLQNEKFIADVGLLGNKLVDKSNPEFLFKKCYHHDIPIEGWTMYAESCWDQIDNNKDLDLPTQQILVAKFKCDEAAASCFEALLSKFDQLKALATELLASLDQIDYFKVGQAFVSQKDAILSEYDSLCSKYNHAIYDQRRYLLNEKIVSKLGEIVSLYIQQLAGSSIKEFSLILGKRSKDLTFFESSSQAKWKVTTAFIKNVTDLSMNGGLSIEEYSTSLESQIQDLINKQKLVELNWIVKKFDKKLNTSLKLAMTTEILNPTPSTWDNILAKFESTKLTFLLKYTDDSNEVDFGVGNEPKLTEHTLKTIEFRSWQIFQDLIQKTFSSNSLFNILKDRFDDKFRYDKNGLPRFYKNAQELETVFADSKNYALSVFPILTVAILSDGKKIEPKMDLQSVELRRKFLKVQVLSDDQKEEESFANPDTDSEDESKEHEFSTILNETEKKEILSKFKREVDTKFVETKRSIVQHITQIPYYIYLIILVLGWNEFVAILRNPFFFTLLLLIGAGVYLMYLMHLLGPALAVGQKAINEAVLIGKQKLREILLDPHEYERENQKLEFAPSKVESTDSVEEIELDTLEPVLSEEMQ